MAYVHCLMKFFSKREFAERFLQGELYARRLYSFRTLHDQDGRADEYEGAVAIPSDNLVLTLRSTNLETRQIRGFEIPGEGMDGPLIIMPQRLDNLNLYCMYAIHSGGFEETGRDDFADYEQHLKISDQCLGLGCYTVAIFRNNAFMNRARNAVVREGYRLNSRLVQYYDPEVGSPFDVDDDRIVFTKRKEFAWQREYRFAIDTGTNGLEPIILNIGPIDDIAMLMRTEDVNRTLKIYPPQMS